MIPRGDPEISTMEKTVEEVTASVPDEAICMSMGLKRLWMISSVVIDSEKFSTFNCYNCSLLSTST